MIGFSLDQAKGAFFDRPAILNAVDKATVKVLSRFGSFVRTRASSSIKPVPKKASTRAKRGILIGGKSSPGNPPVSHTGLLKDFIFFFFDAGNRSVIVGAAKLSGLIGDAPHALEHGGTSTAFVGKRGNRKRISTRVRARPFMAPAFAAERSKLDSLWANSVK